jgi:predicted RNA binding protein YcfA (HicA-like mRNA interferase family)
MPEIPGVSHRRAVRALQKLGYRVIREGKHTIMARDSEHILVVPRHNPIRAGTMGAIAKDAGLTPAEFRPLL